MKSPLSLKLQIRQRLRHSTNPQHRAAPMTKAQLKALLAKIQQIQTNAPLLLTQIQDTQAFLGNLRSHFQDDLNALQPTTEYPGPREPLETPEGPAPAA